MSQALEFGTVWSRNQYSLWTVERTYPLPYLATLGLSDRPGVLKSKDNRLYAWLPQGTDANSAWLSCETCKTLNPCDAIACQSCLDSIEIGETYV